MELKKRFFYLITKNWDFEDLDSSNLFVYYGHGLRW